MDYRNDEPKHPFPQECSINVDLCFLSFLKLKVFNVDLIADFSQDLCFFHASAVKSTQHIYDLSQQKDREVACAKHEADMAVAKMSAL